MKLLKVTKHTRGKGLYEAVEVLTRGGIVAYPTETFYGLGVKFDMEEALKRLYIIKERYEEKAVPLIIGDRRLLSILTAYTNNTALSCMERYWPGPLTLLLHAKEDLSKLVTAGTDKVAVRIPGESFALHLARLAGFPITATSANISGMPPAQDAETVVKYFNDKIDLIIDEGWTPGGLPSTIVDVTGEKIKLLREGAINFREVGGIGS